MSNPNDWATFEKARKYWWIGVLAVVVIVIIFFVF